MRRRREIDSPLITVVTDMDVHGLWFVRPCERFIVATEESAEILVAGGINRRAIDVTGIPIDPCFEALPSRSAAREALQLPIDRPVVLFASGGVGTGRLEQIFAQLLEIAPPVHVVAICGRNRRAERALGELLRSRRNLPGQSAQVIGFTERMHEWMAAADLLVGKPGGLTSSEARAAGLPMLVVDPVPGQEQRNADHLLEWGVARRANTLSTLRWKVDALLRDREGLERLRRCARLHSRPDSAAQACQALLGAAGRSPSAVDHGAETTT
jgi:processive 1,2-diacylglycerol beta-glucosyltransferase